MGTVKEEAARFLREVWDDMVKPGATELAAGVLRHHDGFVLYGKGGEQHQPETGQPPEVVQLEQAEGVQQQQQTQSHGVRR